MVDTVTFINFGWVKMVRPTPKYQRESLQDCTDFPIPHDTKADAAAVAALNAMLARPMPEPYWKEKLRDGSV